MTTNVITEVHSILTFYERSQMWCRIIEQPLVF